MNLMKISHHSRFLYCLIKFFKEENLPLEFHKVRIVQKLHLLPIEKRLEAIKQV